MFEEPRKFHQKSYSQAPSAFPPNLRTDALPEVPTAWRRLLTDTFHI